MQTTQLKSFNLYTFEDFDSLNALEFNLFSHDGGSIHQESPEKVQAICNTEYENEGKKRNN